jgi:hypothetical protein
MAITTYATLKTAVATRLARSNMTSLIPDFIYHAHSKMMRGDPSINLPPLRISDMLTTADLTPSSGSATLPAAYLEMKRIYTNNSTTDPLRYKPPEDWYGYVHEGEAGTPKFYTIEGTTLKIAPHNTTTIKILYYAALTQMSADADYNAVITNAPHVYLFGALGEAYDHIRQHERAQMYNQKFAAGVQALNDASDNGQMSGGPLIMMPSAVA